MLILFLYMGFRLNLWVNYNGKETDMKNAILVLLMTGSTIILAGCHASGGIG